MEDDNDVLPPVVRKKAKSFLRVFGVPLAVAVAVGAIAWSLSKSTDSVVVDKKATVEGSRSVKGVVIRNYQPAGSLIKNSSYVEVLAQSDETVKIFYLDETGRCAGASTAGADDLDFGDKIEAYGSDIADGVMSVCRDKSHYLRSDGKADMVADWKVFDEPFMPVAFRYPASWSAATSSYTGVDSVRLFSPSSREPEVTISSFAAKDFGIDEWIMRYYEPSTAQSDEELGKTDLVIDEHLAVLVTRMDGAGGKAIFTKAGDRMMQMETRERSDIAEAGERSRGLVAELVVSTVDLKTGPQQGQSELPPVMFPVPVSQSSGLRGVVMLGPACPGPVTAGDPNCADRPHAASFVVFDQTGRIVTRFSSGSDGRFQIPLQPGSYVISSESGTEYPSFRRLSVVVTGDRYLDVVLKFDSGLR